MVDKQKRVQFSCLNCSVLEGRYYLLSMNLIDFAIDTVHILPKPIKSKGLAVSLVFLAVELLQSVDHDRVMVTSNMT